MVDSFQTDFSTTQKQFESDRMVLSDFPRMYSHLATEQYVTFDTSIFKTGGRSLLLTWGGLQDRGQLTENPRPFIMTYNMPTEYWGFERFFIPSDFKLSQWQLLMEMFSGRWLSASDPNINSYVKRGAPIYFEGRNDPEGTGDLRLVTHMSDWNYTPDGQSYTRVVHDKVVLSNLVKRGEWFELYYHVKIAQAGICELWFKSDSVPFTKIWNYQGETRSISPAGGLMPVDIQVVDHYKRVDEPVSKLYLDYVRWDVYNFFEEAPPTPPIPKAVLAVGLPFIAGFILMQLGRG